MRKQLLRASLWALLFSCGSLPLLAFHTNDHLASTHEETSSNILLACFSDVNISLPASGFFEISPSDILSPSSDLSGADSVYVTPRFISCSDLGSLTVTVTASVGGTPVNTCFSTVTVEDKIAPSVSCVSSLNLSLDGSGAALLTPEMLLLNSTDNCDLSFSLSQSIFDCSDAGNSFTITLTAQDAGGNTSSCQSLVLVEDKLAPIAICPDTLIVDLAGAASVTLAPTDVDEGSFDNCGIANFALSQSVFTNADLGNKLVSLTVEDLAGNINICNTVVQVIDNSLTYCAAAGLNTSFEHIRRVKLRQIRNNSGDDGGYADFTSQHARLRQGRNYKLVLRPGFPGASYTENWKVWIDWNQDGDFEDPLEEIYQGASDQRIVHFFDVPTTATLGQTRMRVAMRFGGIPQSCGNFSFGEVEDYNITVRAAPSPKRTADTSPQKANFHVFPNPARAYVTLSIDPQLSIQAIELWQLNGQLLRRVQAAQGSTNYRLDLNHLPTDMYILKVKTATEVLTRRLYHLAE